MSHAQDMPMTVDETDCDTRTEDRDDMECESPSQAAVNVLADVTPSKECSQIPTTSTRVASSQQPSVETLRSLGVKVRDFAYESTLPAIIPVPRVPRQVQPGPEAPKRPQRDWDNKEGRLNSVAFREEAGFKKAKLERKPTEPLEEPVVRHLRTLRRTLTVKRVCSIITPPSRSTATRTRFSTSPPTSPLTPPLSHIASQESEVVRTPSSFPFIVRIDDASMIPASQFDPESQPLSLRPIVYTRFALEPHTSAGFSRAPSPPRTASPVPLLSPLLELPSPVKEPGTDPRARKRRRRGIVGINPPPCRYYLRQRPAPPSSLSIASSNAPRPRRTRRTVKS